MAGWCSLIRHKMPARPTLITSLDQIAVAPAGSCSMSTSRQPGGLKDWRCWGRAAAERTIRLGRGPARTISLFRSSRTINPASSIDTIVSEHYDDRDPIAARLMDRFYYSYSWGWLRRAHWEKTGTPPSDLPQRCPYVSLSEYPSGGGEDWRMVDCRMWTNIRAENGERIA